MLACNGYWPSEHAGALNISGLVNRSLSAGISFAGASRAALNAAHLFGGRTNRVWSAKTFSAAAVDEFKTKSVSEFLRSFAADFRSFLVTGATLMLIRVVARSVLVTNE